MTTPAAERLYQAQHEVSMEGRRYAIYNPHNKPVEELPYIYGFNNGGAPKFLEGALVAEDGTYLGGHCCSHECYMRHDLGIFEGTRPDRHETFRAHYPDGYRMTFISYDDYPKATALHTALERAKARKEQETQPTEGDPS